MALEVNISKSQSEMDDQFVREYMAAVGPGGNFNEFLDDWGMSEEEVIDYLEANPQLLPEGFDSQYEGDIPEDGDDRDIDLSMPEGLKFPSLTDEQIDNIQNFIPAARLGKVVNAGKSMFGDAMNKLFASSKLKANQLANRGATGEVVKGASRKLKASNLRPSINNKTADRYKSMSDKVKTKRAAEAATVAGAGTAMYLAGDTPEDGESMVISKQISEPKTQSRNLKGNRDTDGSLIDLNKIARADRDVGVEEPTGPDMPETMGNQFGYHKQEGQNFWTVNNDDAYWDTHEMGTGDAWSDADLKEVVQELDWSSWFK
jgi:hypothetical protein